MHCEERHENRERVEMTERKVEVLPRWKDCLWQLKYAELLEGPFQTSFVAVSLAASLATTFSFQMPLSEAVIPHFDWRYVHLNKVAGKKD